MECCLLEVYRMDLNAQCLRTLDLKLVTRFLPTSNEQKVFNKCRVLCLLKVKS